MPDQPSPQESSSDDAARRRRLADVFGDVLPESTSDDKPDRATDGVDDSWYTDNRPPHHDSG